MVVRVESFLQYLHVVVTEHRVAGVEQLSRRRAPLVVGLVLVLPQ